MYQSAVAPSAARILLICARNASRRDVDTVSEIVAEVGGLEIVQVNSLIEISRDQVSSSDLVLIVGWQADRQDVGFLEIFRRLEPRKPVLVVATTDDPGCRSAAFVKGANNYLMPGFQKDEMVAKVSRLIALSNSGLESAPITTSTLRIWPEQRIVMQGNERVLLSRKELAMLLCLARNSPNPVSREVLEREAFGLRCDPGTNVVAVHIHRLRTKLENGTDVLRTVAGKGYQLC